MKIRDNQTAYLLIAMLILVGIIFTASRANYQGESSHQAITSSRSTLVQGKAQRVDQFASDGTKPKHDWQEVSKMEQDIVDTLDQVDHILR